MKTYQVVLNNFPNLNLQILVYLDSGVLAEFLVESLNDFFEENGDSDKYLAEFNVIEYNEEVTDELEIKKE